MQYLWWLRTFNVERLNVQTLQCSFVANFYSCSYLFLSFTKNLQKGQKHFYLLCNSKEESRTAHDGTRQYKGRRGLKGSRWPAKLGRLILFRASCPTLPTTAVFPLSPPRTRFCTAREENVYCNLIVEYNRPHTLSFAQRVALQPTARTLFPIVDHDFPGETPRIFEILRGHPLHTPLRLFSSWSPGPNFLILRRPDE